jgi:hypothetical protein
MSDLLWLPIDIPKFPIENFRVKSKFRWNFWDVTKLTEDRSSPYERTVLTQEIVSEYPELVEWFSNFPYLSIRNIKFNVQRGAVAKHIDFTKPGLEPLLHSNNRLNEPCGYRILLKGSRSNRLYILKDGIKHYVTLPETTDTYVLGHTNALHGVDEDADRLTIFMHFEIDSTRHQRLLAASMKKYAQYAVFS